MTPTPEDLAGAVLTIDLVALKENWRRLNTRAGKAECGAAVKGNAYGLANTLTQTALLKPSLKHKTLSNLYFCGQLTVPGPGVPPSLISGQVVAGELMKEHPLKA